MGKCGRGRTVKLLQKVYIESGIIERDGVILEIKDHIKIEPASKRSPKIMNEKSPANSSPDLPLQFIALIACLHIKQQVSLLLVVFCGLLKIFIVAYIM